VPDAKRLSAPREGFDETAAFIKTLLEAAPDQLTACQGWTAHEIVAHLAAGSAEIADLIDGHLAGKPATPTRRFEERERPYRELDHRVLLERLISEATRATSARTRLAQHPEDAVAFTGRLMRAGEFSMHSRSECVLHRWDLVGRDDIGWLMLSQPDLCVHAVKILTEMPALAETPANRLLTSGWPGQDFEILLRSGDNDDLVISQHQGRTNLRLEAQRDRRVDVDLDSSARLLALWGRREQSTPIRVNPAADRTLLWCLFRW
jgi:uncharacterized protein (TIGR03083 family)